MAGRGLNMDIVLVLASMAISTAWAAPQTTIGLVNIRCKTKLDYVHDQYRIFIPRYF